MTRRVGLVRRPGQRRGGRHDDRRRRARTAPRCRARSRVHPLHDLPDARARHAAAGIGRFAVLRAAPALPSRDAGRTSRPGRPGRSAARLRARSSRPAARHRLRRGGRARQDCCTAARQLAAICGSSGLRVQVLDVEHAQRAGAPRLRRGPGRGQRRAVVRRRAAHGIEQQARIGHRARHRADDSRSRAAGPAGRAGAARR